MSELWERDAWMLADAVRAGDLRARDVLDVHLERIERHNPALNAVCELDVDGARRRADDIDRRVAAGEDPGPLAGIPMGIKELTQAEGFPDTHASLIHRGNVATADHHEVARLRGAGAVVVGLTTSPEFGSVSFTNTPMHGVTRNPWNVERTPGGSSGGSAAAVAAGLLPACTGSDGGGSIRIPSAYSGLFGWKTTFGRIAAGPGPYDGSLNSVHGPIVRSVRDAARYLDVTAGPSLTDPTSLPKPGFSYEQLVTGDARAMLRGKRVAWSSTLGYGVVDANVEAVVREAADALVSSAGLELVDLDVRLPPPGRSWSIQSSVDLAAWNLDVAREHWDELTPTVRAGMQMVDHLRPDGLLKAIRRRHELLTATAAVFSQVDLLLTPTTATTALPAEGEFMTDVNGTEVNLFVASAAFTAPFNMTGQPAVSVPAGFVDGMPVGLHVVARRLEDELPLAAGAVLEDVRPWPKLAPGW
ncbi:MAG TPA: amidase [Acidimicrobiia bacterium]|jgi:aspartyl-tRNA(Asn)/glutamyl-tRNA(Gln) amidotransferase subunit A